MTELEELSTSFSRLRPREDPDHASVERARAAKQQVERRLLPIMSRWQRPHDDEVTRAVPLVPKPEDIKTLPRLPARRRHRRHSRAACVTA